jgi:hypothetical protein
MCRPKEGDEPYDLVVPSYCCWEGVLCCHEHSIFTADATKLSCAHYSVFMLQLRAGNLTGTLDGALDHIQMLHKHGLVALDMSRNQITGDLPEQLNQLTNLQLLLFGANSKLIDGADLCFHV